MKMELGVTELSAVIAAAGVLVGMIIAVVELRNLVKQRKTDLVTRLSNDIALNRERLEVGVDVKEAQFEDYDDFVRKYGKFYSKNQVPMAFMTMGNFYEQIGILLRNKLIDASLVDQLFAVCATWEKMKPIVEGMRKEYHDPMYFEAFEYLYNEMKKREQSGVKHG
jgi:Domain of unknown function (DUF4760)